MKKTRVLIVDDSALVRQMLNTVLSEKADIEIVGTARDAFRARELIKELNPDVITLDVEMPKMDGITFLANLMRLRPLPVIMVSTLTRAGSEATLNAMELGAVDYIQKPSASLKGDIQEFSDDLHAKVVAAAGANLHQVHDYMCDRYKHRTKYVLENKADQGFDHLVAIGASTGGTEAIKEVLSDLPAQTPPIVIAQHMPPGYSHSFAKRLNGICEMHVFEAEHEQPINEGTAYIAPGGKHLKVNFCKGHYICELSEDARVNRHRPSVEVLFDSVSATATKPNAIGIILTGMGDDGAAGLLRMRQKGCYTVAQDKKTSLIWGMPGSAVEIGAAEEVLPLHRIATRIMQKPSTSKSNAHFKAQSG